MQSFVDRDTFCTKCGYNLRGQVEPRCPECGEAFDPAAEPPPPRRIQWILVLLPAGIGLALLLAIVFFFGAAWVDSLPLPQALYDRAVIELGRGEVCWAQVIAVVLCSFPLGGVFGLVLSLGASKETHLSTREITLTAVVMLLLMVGLAVLLMLNESFWAFEIFEVFCLVVICAITPFTLGEWAVTWARGRRFRRGDI